MKCIICGKDEARTVRFTHGSIHICSRQSCVDRMMLTMEGAVPILYAGRSDFEEHELGRYIEDLSDNDFIAVTKELTDTVLDDLFWNNWHEALAEVHEGVEKWIVEDCPIEDLPLMAGTLEYPRNEKLLEGRLKHE